jgi:predicted metal-dependent hydrolase
LNRLTLSRWLGDLLGRKVASPLLEPLVQDRIFIYRDQSIAYKLIRRPRKTIGFRIADNGLQVSAPSWVSLADIEEGLRDKANWIMKHIGRIESPSVLRQDRYYAYLAQKSIPLWGQAVLIRPNPASGFRLIQENDHSLVLFASETDRRERLIGWLKKEARTDFDIRIKRFSRELGFGPARWQLSSAKTRWGSCNSKAVIRLNWRLIHHDPKLIDYVVVHELAHLKELNHSARFWAIVESVLPDYRERRSLLRHDHDPGTSLIKET